MKEVIAIIMTLTIVLLSGCSSVKKSEENNNQQVQSQLENTSQNSATTQDNTDPSLLENIDTTKSPFRKGYYDYQGNINNTIPIKMSIYQLDKDVVGTYFYEKQREEIKLKGKAGEKDIILFEYNGTGVNTGVFQGKLVTVDKIEGTWVNPVSKQSYPFTLSLQSNLPEVEYGKRYSVALNTKNDQDVENFAGRIQGYLVNENKEQLAEQVVYPITVKIDDKVTKIQNNADFVKNYDQIFYPKYRQVITNAYTKYLFANWQGIMLGEGIHNIWINEVKRTDSDSRLMINAINN
ncbi:hypothetical protein [Desulfosporosinus fructosivorans]